MGFDIRSVLNRTHQVVFNPREVDALLMIARVSGEHPRMAPELLQEIVEGVAGPVRPELASAQVMKKLEEAGLASRDEGVISIHPSVAELYHKPPRALQGEHELAVMISVDPRTRRIRWVESVAPSQMDAPGGSFPQR